MQPEEGRVKQVKEAGNACVWVSAEASPCARIQMKVVYLGGYPQKHREARGEVREDREAARAG